MTFSLVFGRLKALKKVHNIPARSRRQRQPGGRIGHLECGFQGRRAVLVPIAGAQDDVLRLTELPQGGIRGMCRHAQTRKRLYILCEFHPEGTPFCGSEQAQKHLHLPCAIMMRHECWR